LPNEKDLPAPNLQEVLPEKRARAQTIGRRKYTPHPWCPSTLSLSSPLSASQVTNWHPSLPNLT